MPQFVCPDCQAKIDRDLIEKSGRNDCPSCGAELSTVGLNQAVALDAAGDADLLQDPQDADSNADAEVAPSDSAVPDQSRIKVIESTPDRLVLFLPGGGRQSNGLGCFALVWNGFMVVFTPAMTVGILKDDGGNAPPLLVVVPFLTIFWAVGLGFAWFWLKFKFERTFILLDRERIAVQKILFNRKRLTEASLDESSRAELVESYQQNDKPVYRVEVRGASGAAAFGTALSNGEKNWLVDRINRFLGVPGNEDDGDSDDGELPQPVASGQVWPTACDKCGAPLAGKPADGVLTCEHCGAVHRSRPAAPESGRKAASKGEDDAPLTADSIPTDSAIHISESSPDRLAFRTGLASSSPLRWGIPLFAFPFAIAWYSFIGFFAWNILREPFGFSLVFPLLFLIPFVAAGLMPLGLGLYALAGNTTVDLTRERLACRWGVGPLRWSRQMAVEMITSVRIERLNNEQRNRRIRGARSGSDGRDSRACVVRGGGKMIPLTILEDAACARQVAALVRTQLADWGHALDHG